MVTLLSLSICLQLKFNFGFIIILLRIIDNYVTQVVLAYMYYVSTYIFLSINTHDVQRSYRTELREGDLLRCLRDGEGRSRECI